MSKASRFLAALGAVLFALTGLSACGGGIPGDAVVQVAGKPVSKTAYTHWLGVAASAGTPAAGGKVVLPEPPNYTACISHLQATTPKPAAGQSAPTPAQLKTQCEQQYKQLQQQVLGFLISSDWVIGEAADLGVKLSDAEVKKQFEKIKGTQFPKPAEFEKFLATTGQTVSDLLLRVKLNMLSTKIQEKIAKKKHAVSQAEVAKYYNENKQRFGTPERRNIEIILTKSEAAAKSAKQEVASGKSFASVAKRVSIDPTSKATGGLLTEVIKGQEEKALDTAVFSTAPNTLSGPLKSTFGYYVYRVKSVLPGSQQTLAQAEASIKAQLTATQQQGALGKFVKDFKAKWKAKTDCRAGYIVKDCKQFKEPKTTGLGTAPATP